MCDEISPRRYTVVQVKTALSYGQRHYAIVSRFGLRQEDSPYGWHSSAIIAYCDHKEEAMKVAEALNVLVTLKSHLTPLDITKINNACGVKVL